MRTGTPPGSKTVHLRKSCCALTDTKSGSTWTTSASYCSTASEGISLCQNGGGSARKGSVGGGHGCQALRMGPAGGGGGQQRPGRALGGGGSHHQVIIAPPEAGRRSASTWSHLQQRADIDRPLEGHLQRRRTQPADSPPTIATQHGVTHRGNVWCQCIATENGYSYRFKDSAFDEGRAATVIAQGTRRRGVLISRKAMGGVFLLARVSPHRVHCGGGSGCDQWNGLNNNIS